MAEPGPIPRAPDRLGAKENPTEFFMRVRRAIDRIADILNSLVASGEISRTEGGWTIFGSDEGQELLELINELIDALRDELFGNLELLWLYFRLFLASYIADMGFLPPPGIPSNEISAALATRRR